MLLQAAIVLKINWSFFMENKISLVSVLIS